MKLCKVVKPGIFTTVQDLGRHGYQRYGVPTSGAMDSFAFVTANLLVGNEPADAGLEITLVGPELTLLDDTQIAITGANLSPTINGCPVAQWQTLQVCKTDVLSFGRLKSGCRTYLAVRGGIAVPIVMNSRSTYIYGKFGGFQGRQLRTGDIIKAYDSPTSKSRLIMPSRLIPQYASELTVEVVSGPQLTYFTQLGIETFFSSSYAATPEFDRIGYRLDGPEIEKGNLSAMISDAVPVGAVQVPSNGKPIVVMRDAQTTGGYPKIAIVTTPCVSRLGQVKPNDRVKFSEISLSNAQKRLIEYGAALSQIKRNLVELA
ncbi:MAG: biotin-dependent carboxyltransferase family protein [Candidatus Bathyarchaeota archaeon]|nr:MAG: biotin-dependent carboxyltransferase family protein [Candidatus Bathyarchaeota archaeon]